MTGGCFGAEEAFSAGLIDRVVGRPEIEGALAAALTEIGRCEPAAIAATKRILSRAARLVEPSELDAAAKEFARCLRGAGREGAAAFAQKRGPGWVETYSERTKT